MQKKSDKTYWASFVAKGFQKNERQDCNDSAISPYFTSDMAIQMLLLIKQVAGYNARVINIKGAFLKGGFKNNKEIYMTSLHEYYL